MWPFKKSIGKTISEKHATAPKMTVRAKDNETERLLKDWNSRAVPFVAYTDSNQAKLVGRARNICYQNSYGKAGLRVLRQNIVGEHGIRLQSQVVDADGKIDQKVNTAIEDLWRDFSRPQNCDSAGRKDMLSLQMIALNALVTDGEFFFQKHKDKSLPYGLQLSEVDALRIPPSATNRYRLDTEGQVYKNGIIFDKKTNKPLWYCLNQDKINYYDMSPDKHTQKINATKMIHGFQQDATGQVRGVPLGQTASETLYMIGKYAEAALQNARVGAAKVGFFTQKSDSPPPTTAKVDDKGNPIYDEDGNMVLQSAMDNVKIDLIGGSASVLPTGVGFEAWNPEYPRSEFESFMKVMLRSASVGFSIPYSDISGDLSDVNYSSMRQGALEIRANYKIIQNLLIQYLMAPLYSEWLVSVLMREMLVVDGRTMTIDMYPELHKPTWAPKRWAWIDPRSEAIANQIAMKSGLKSPSQIIKDMGGDPDEVWKSIAQDIEVMKDIGLPEEFVLGIFADSHASVADLAGQAYSSDGTSVDDMSNQN